MSNYAFFTICAKNYIAHAKTLGDSLLKYGYDSSFRILLSDELDGHDLDTGYEIVEAKNLGIPGFEKMAFQYDVVEFSTAIKPFFIQQLFESGYEKVVYLDPDMVVYDRLDFIFGHLDTYDAVLTPHLLKPYINYEGATTEEELLFVGVYNLGFFAVKNSETGRHIVDWWAAKLADQCYADKEDALHVDQRWMDFLPSLYTENILILRHPGVNLAFWNFHERTFCSKEGDYFVDDTFPLAVMHFSGLDVDNYTAVCRKQTKFTLDVIPEYREIFSTYAGNLLKNGYERFSQLPYKYNTFENGVPIVKYHRRLFRGLTAEGNRFDHLFSVAENSYYSFLEKNNAMLIDKSGKYRALRKTYGNSPRVFGKVFMLLKIFKALVGIKRYYLMMRFFAIYHRFENQTFLLKK